MADGSLICQAYGDGLPASDDVEPGNLISHNQFLERRIDVQGEVPVGRDMHAMAALGNKLYVFGGRLRQAQASSDPSLTVLTNELWSFDVVHLKWSLLNEVRASTVLRFPVHDECLRTDSVAWSSRAESQGAPRRSVPIQQ